MTHAKINYVAIVVLLILALVAPLIAGQYTTCSYSIKFYDQNGNHIQTVERHNVYRIWVNEVEVCWTSKPNQKHYYTITIPKGAESYWWDAISGTCKNHRE